MLMNTQKTIRQIKFHSRFASAVYSLILLAAMCSCSSSEDGLTGREYEGYYKTCERISIEFEKDSKVVVEISSTDFVGHFSDRLYGHYEYKHPYITINWTEVDSDNDEYKSIISSPDSIIINESLDTLRLWETNEEYVLPKYQLYHIDRDASFSEQIAEYCYLTIILIIVFVIEYYFYIVLAGIILILVIIWWRKIHRRR